MISFQLNYFVGPELYILTNDDEDVMIDIFTMQYQSKPQMNTKLIMTSTAIFLAAIGICLTFAPDNIIVLLGINNSIVVRLILQLLGAAYFAFAMLNWMAKGAIIGGIYNRPIAIANLSHFAIGGLALTKAVLSNHQLPLIFSTMAGFYVTAACVFGLVISRHPGTTAG